MKQTTSPNLCYEENKSVTSGCANSEGLVLGHVALAIRHVLYVECTNYEVKPAIIQFIVVPVLSKTCSVPWSSHGSLIPSFVH